LTLPAEIQTAKNAFENAPNDTSQLQVGQHVQVRLRLLLPAVLPDLPTVETDRVRLRETRMSATVASSASTTFIVEGLPPIFAHLTPPVSSIRVFTSVDTDFENATGVSDLAGALVSLRGFLFKDATPKMFAVKVRKRVTP
jgi:hypothetical protein